MTLPMANQNPSFESEGIEMEVETNQANTSNNIVYPLGWKEKRRKTIFMFLLNRFLQGLEFTAIFTTLWSYVNNDMQHADPDSSYGLIAAGRFVVPVLFSTLVARWFDKTRSTKKLMITVTLFMDFGYLLYLFHFSPYIPMLGTIFQGTSFSLTMACNSEIFRVYPEQEVQRQILYLLIAYGLGETAGPIIIRLLNHVQFKIWKLKVIYGNIASLVLLAANTIRLVLIYNFTFDLSKEFDLKAKESKASSAASTPQISWYQTLKESFSFDAAFLLVQQIYTGFLVSFFCRAFPLVVIDTLQYNNFILDICFLGASVSMTAISLLVSKANLSSRGIYICGILCLISLLFCHLLLYLIPKRLSRALDITLVSVFVFLYAFCWISDQTFIVTTLGKLFPSCVQSSIEGIRMLLHIGGSFTASLASVYIYRNFNYVALVSVPVLVCLLMGMVARRGVLSNPKVKQGST